MWSAYAHGLLSIQLSFCLRRVQALSSAQPDAGTISSTSAASAYSFAQSTVSLPFARMHISFLTPVILGLPFVCRPGTLTES